MKRYSALLCAVLFLSGLLAACTAGTSSGTQSTGHNSTVNEPEEHTPLAPPEDLLENLLLQLNDLLDNDYIRESADCYDLEDLSVFVLGEVSTYSNLVLVKEKATQEIYSFSFTVGEIIAVYQAEEPGCISIATSQAAYYGGDSHLHFPKGYVTVQYTDGEVVSGSPKSHGWNEMIGLERGGDTLLFDECIVEGNLISFTFAAGENSYTYADSEQGTEIYLSRDVHRDKENSSTHVIVFNQTQCNLPEEFIEQINAMDGVLSAEFSYIESPLFDGTQLVLEVDNDNWALFFLNKSGSIHRFEDFTIEIIRK